MTRTDSAIGPTVAERWRGARWVLLGLVIVIGVATLSTYLTAPRPGGPMDPESTSPEGARALVTILREHGVDVITAGDIASVEKAARPDTLLVVAQTFYLFDDDVLRRLAALPGDRLLVAPVSRTREALAPEIRLGGTTTFGDSKPDCDLREAKRAGEVQFGLGDGYEAAGDVPVTRCYGGALVRYTHDDREVTVVSAADFMTNAGLLKQGNAALAMNLAGSHPRVIWYAPQHSEGGGESGGGAGITDFIPDQAGWVVLQLCLVVALLALWKGRRIGPLVAEQLPVVVRASETVEGRGRLYRSRRARDRAAEALRTAALQRMMPRIGLGHDAEPPAVVMAVAERCGLSPQAVAHTAVRPAPGQRLRSGQPRPRTRQHRKAGRSIVTQPIAQTAAAPVTARNALLALRGEIAKAVVGQDAVVSGLVIALLCRGHVLLEGVPGVAKTLLVRTLAAALQLDFKRVQFTPDLMPGDVTGSLVYDARTAEFEFHSGPVFTNLLLADEINRTPPKTQAALLEAMEERQVSVEGQPRPLPDPFIVAATQNPIEYEGTYQLPEAQLDRFLLKLNVPLPPRDQEIAILDRHARGFDPRDLSAVKPVAGVSELAAGREAVRQVLVADEVLGYIVDIVGATRHSPSLQLGVSPRGATALLATARSWAWLSGRNYVTPDDVKAMARPTLRHRVALRPEAELEGANPDGVLDGILAAVPVPR